MQELQRVHCKREKREKEDEVEQGNNVREEKKWDHELRIEKGKRIF